MAGMMAGMTDTAFRRLVKSRGGCGLVVTEMVSSEGLIRGIDRTLDYAEYTEEELQQLVSDLQNQSEGDSEPANEEYDSPQQVDYRGEFKPELGQLLSTLKDQDGASSEDATQQLSKEQIEEMLSKSVELQQPDQETGQTIISGMGELHLEVIADRLKREFNVNINIGNPQVSYKEGITKEVQQKTKYIKQSGGRGQYGHVEITLEPNDLGKGFEFENKIKGGVIPKEYIPSVKNGVEEAAKNGVLAGFPIEDIKIILTFGSYHDVDSSEMAFKIAGSMAFKEAVIAGRRAYNATLGKLSLESKGSSPLTKFLDQ